MGTNKSKKNAAALNYGILGEDQMSDEEKIAKYTGDVDWEYVEPHYKAGNVVYVDPELNLAIVGTAFAEDDKEQVNAWLKKADIIKPGHHHADWWEHDKTRFNALIIKPFVLIQPIQSV